MQVKYKVNTRSKATLSNRTIKKVAAALDKRKIARRLIRFIVILVILVIIIYLVVSGNDEGMRLAENYDRLKARTDDSKQSFDRRIKLFEKNADGEIILTDTATSALNEEQQEETTDKESTNKNLNGVKFEFTSGIDWSVAAGDNITKQKSLEAAYNYAKDAGMSRELISGILGNIMCEGSIGQFEGDPHCADTYSWQKKDGSWEHRYYNDAIGICFDSTPGDGTITDGYEGNYVDKYRYKKIGENLSLSWNEFYRICDVARQINSQGDELGFSWENPFPGIGSIGQTAKGYFDAYCEWMENNGYKDSGNQITQDELVLCDVYTIYNGHLSPEDYITKFASDADYYVGIFESRWNGPVTPAVKAAWFWLGKVEQPGDWKGYEGSTQYIERAEWAEQIYELIGGGST